MRVAYSTRAEGPQSHVVTRDASVSKNKVTITAPYRFRCMLLKCFSSGFKYRFQSSKAARFSSRHRASVASDSQSEQKRKRNSSSYFSLPAENTPEPHPFPNNSAPHLHLCCIVFSDIPSFSPGLNADMELRVLLSFHLVKSHRRFVRVAVRRIRGHPELPRPEILNRLQASDS